MTTTYFIIQDPIQTEEEEIPIESSEIPDSIPVKVKFPFSKKQIVKTESKPIPLDHEYIACDEEVTLETEPPENEEISDNSYFGVSLDKLKNLATRFAGVPTDENQFLNPDTKLTLKVNCKAKHNHNVIHEYFETLYAGRIRARALNPYAMIREAHSPSKWGARYTYRCQVKNCPFGLMLRSVYPKNGLSFGLSGCIVHNHPLQLRVRQEIVFDNLQEAQDFFNKNLEPIYCCRNSRIADERLASWNYECRRKYIKKGFVDCVSNVRIGRTLAKTEKPGISHFQENPYSLVGFFHHVHPREKEYERVPLLQRKEIELKLSLGMSPSEVLKTVKPVEGLENNPTKSLNIQYICERKRVVTTKDPNILPKKLGNQVLAKMEPKNSLEESEDITDFADDNFETFESNDLDTELESLDLTVVSRIPGLKDKIKKEIEEYREQLEMRKLVHNRLKTLVRVMPTLPVPGQNGEIDNMVKGMFEILKDFPFPENEPEVEETPKKAEKTPKSTTPKRKRKKDQEKVNVKREKKTPITPRIRKTPQKTPKTPQTLEEIIEEHQIVNYEDIYG